jgi:hypothetical protein
MDEQAMSPNGRVICGLFSAGTGLLMLLFGLGVLPFTPRPGEAPLWVMAAAGLMFLLVGVSITIGAFQGVSQNGELPENTDWRLRIFYYMAGLAAVVALAAIGSWVAFGPGARAFSGPGMFLLSRETNNIIGRIVFGFGTLLTWLCVLVFAIGGARKSFPRKAP